MKTIILATLIVLSTTIKAQNNKYSDVYDKINLQNSDSVIRLMGRLPLQIIYNITFSEMPGYSLDTVKLENDLLFTAICFEILYGRKSSYLRTAYYYRGWISHLIDDHQSAIKDLTSALNEQSSPSGYPTVETIKGLRGECKAEMEDYQGAILDLTYAIDHTGDDKSQYYYERGRAKAMISKVGEAINDMSYAISERDKYDDAYFWRGVYLISSGSKSNGCLDLSKAGELGNKKAYQAIKKLCNN